MHSDFKQWLEGCKGTFPDRRAKLQHIASGPEYRQDVQAARNLLMKPRYTGMTGNQAADVYTDHALSLVPLFPHIKRENFDLRLQWLNALIKESKRDLFNWNA